MDVGEGCSTDPDGNVYLTGQTMSANNIATAGAFQNTLEGGEDAFLVKFDNTGLRLWGTYYGGTNQEWALSCSADHAGNIYMAG